MVNNQKPIPDKGWRSIVANLQLVSVDLIIEHEVASSWENVRTNL